MSTLITLNLLISMRLRDWLVITAFFIVLSFAHLSLALTYERIYSTTLHLSDYLLISMGGVLVNGSFWMLFGWLGTLLPLLFCVYRLTGVTGYDLNLLTRINSRSKWWIAKIVSILLLSILYCAWYVLLHLLIGSLVFSSEPMFSSFLHENYPYIVQLGLSPFELLMWVTGLFVTGLIAIAALAQTLALLFHNSTSAYAVFTIYLLVTGSLTLQGTMAKWLAPVMYPSFVNLFQTETGLSLYTNSLRFNILLACLCFVMSIVRVRKYSI